MRQMLKPFKPAEDRFAGVDVQTSEATGAVIIPESAAYLECTVASRMETGDHILVYATVDEGKVSTVHCWLGCLGWGAGDHILVEVCVHVHCWLGCLGWRRATTPWSMPQWRQFCPAPRVCHWPGPACGPVAAT